MKQEVYKVLDELTERIERIEALGYPMDIKSWIEEDGILISGNDAKILLQHIESLNEDNINLVKAHGVISKINSENRRKKEYMIDVSNEMLDMLHECLNQLEYIQVNNPTGTSASLIPRLGTLVTKYTRS